MTLARREFMAGLAATLLPPASTQKEHPRPHPPRTMYVGSFTKKDGGRGEGLSVYTRARDSDPWALIQLLKDIPDPSFVIVDRQGRCAYSAHGDGTQVTSYRIDPTSGRLTVLNQQPTSGTNGVHVAIDGTNRFLALANYATGSLVALPINDDGSLAPVCDLAPTKGTPGPHRTQQDASHPHHNPFDRTGRFIVVPDKGLDKVFVYRLDTAARKLVPVVDVASRAGAAPRHVDFHPTLPIAYVINELDSTIATYQFEPEKSVMKPLQVSTTLPSSHTGNNSGAEIRVAPSGRFVYGSNRGHDSIAIFAVDGTTGLLTPVGWEPTQGRTPRFFTLDPSASYLYAANQNSDTVVVFRVDERTGKLSAANQVITVATPTTLAFR